MHLIYLSFNIFCIFEKTYVNISILLTFNLLAVNLMSLVIFRTCYIRPPALAGESMNSDLSVHSSIFMSVFDTVFSELDQEFFLLFSQSYDQKNFVIVFLWIWSRAKIIFIAIFLLKYHIWEKFAYWDMSQNALSPLDCRVFKSDIKHEKIDELTWFLVFRYRFNTVAH